MYLSQISKYICLKLQNVSVPNGKMYLSLAAECISLKLQNVFVFNCKVYSSPTVVRGDWGSIVTMWQADCHRDDERNRRREDGMRTRGKQREEEEEARLSREVLKLIGSCEVGKAVELPWISQYV